MPLTKPLCSTVSSGEYSTGGVAEVDVAGAQGHVDERVVGERVVGPVEVEDPAPQARALGRQVEVVEVVLAAGAGEGAGLGVDAGATAFEVEHDLGRVGPTLPEGELAAIGTLTVAPGHDLLPVRLAGGTRSARPARPGDGIRCLARLLGGLELR